MLTLYYAPKACSFAPHAILAESGLPYRIEHIDIFAGATRTPEYLAINPRGRIPALRLASGEILTEVVAILNWIAEQVPEKELIPKAGLQRARCFELLAYIATRVHPSFAQVVKPDRFSPEAGDHGRITAHGVHAYAESLRLMEGLLSDGPYALGEKFSVVDPYIGVFFNCAKFIELDLAPLPKLSACVANTFARPAVRGALVAEGLIPANAA